MSYFPISWVSCSESSILSNGNCQFIQQIRRSIMVSTSVEKDKYPYLKFKKNVLLFFYIFSRDCISNVHYTFAHYHHRITKKQTKTAVIWLHRLIVSLVVSEKILLSVIFFWHKLNFLIYFCTFVFMLTLNVFLNLWTLRIWNSFLYSLLELTLDNSVTLSMDGTRNIFISAEYRLHYNFLYNIIDLIVYKFFIPYSDQHLDMNYFYVYNIIEVRIFSLPIQL